MKNIVFFVLAFISSLLNSNAQQIENLRIMTLNDKVNLKYDITHEKAGQLFNIKLSCSNDGGANFNIPLNSLSGDYGKGIEGGKDKIAVWDVLSDQKSLKGSKFVFKIVASPGEIKNKTDHIEAFNFELIDFYKKDRNIVCTLKIINNGAKRDLKLINRLAKIYDYRGRCIEAQSSKIGEITGNNNYSAPTLSFKSGQTDIAVFNFKISDGFSNRIKLFDLGVEILEITYGLDLKTGNMQFKDISLDSPKTPAKTELISQSLSFSIEPENKNTKDTNPPIVSIVSPKIEKDKSTIVNREEVFIYGKVNDENGVFELTINGIDAQPDENGNFESEVYLVEGNNTLFMRATDVFQNTIEETFSLIYQPLNKKDQRLTAINKDDMNSSMLSKEEISNTKYYALLIGVNKYPDSEIVNLEQPVSDTEKLYKTLTTYYTFKKENTKLLKNPTREEIIGELDCLNSIITVDDNLIVFYAGHGYWDEQDEIGYWLPSDAKRTNTANWIRNSTIRDYLRAIKTKHTLLVADACFSGGIFKTRKAFANAPKSIQKLYEYPSRKAMTSGTLKEVPDRSVFLLYLNKRLTENTQAYISAEELFSSFKIAVLNNSPNIPQYGEIKDTGDEGGDFIFIKKTN